MGTFSVIVELGDPQGQRYETVEALVDTGASYTTAPADLLHRLGVVPTERRPFRLADDRHVDREVGQTWVRLDGRTVMTIVVFEPGAAGVLLGAVTLEELGLAVDSLGRRLLPTEGLLMLFLVGGRVMVI